MIFPSDLPLVTFYLEGLDEYHEVGVFASSMEFKFEPYYLKEAVSASKKVKFRGVRFDMRLSLDQTRSHGDLKAFYESAMKECVEGNGRIRLYLVKESVIEAQTDYLQVVVENLESVFSVKNHVGRQSYQMSFSGLFSEMGIGLAYVIDNDGFFVFNNEGRRMVVQFDQFA